MERRYRVLFVPGSGNRDVVSTRAWRGSDVGVGLRRALPAYLLARLDVESSTHERLLRAAPTVPTLIGPLGRRCYDPGPAIDCECCAKRSSYRWYSELLSGLPPETRTFVENELMGWRHSIVLRLADDPALRAAVRQRVGEDLDRVNPHILVAHGLGSVVAIEALAVSGWSPQLLITAGAPLGWQRFAQTWSLEARGWLSEKSCPWINLIDLSDELTGCQIPPSSPYASALHVLVNGAHCSTFAGPDGGSSGTHLLRHYLHHPVVQDAFLTACDGDRLP